MFILTPVSHDNHVSIAIFPFVSQFWLAGIASRVAMNKVASQIVVKRNITIAAVTAARHAAF